MSFWADGNIAEAAGKLWKMVEHTQVLRNDRSTQIKVNPSEDYEQMGHPVEYLVVG